MQSRSWLNRMLPLRSPAAMGSTLTRWPIPFSATFNCSDRTAAGLASTATVDAPMAAEANTV
jgi:hypothetical protein